MEILSVSSKVGYVASQVDKQTGMSDTIFGFLADWWWVLVILGIVVLALCGGNEQAKSE